MLAVGLAAVRLEAAALLPANQQKIEAADESLRHAAELYRKHKLEDFGKVIDEVDKSLEELKASDQKDDAAPMIEQLELRLASAQKLLKYAVDSAATAKGPAKKVAAKPNPKTMARTPAKPNPMAKAMPANELSFANKIGPLLNSRCGRCHTNNPKGGFSVATYADIRRGSDGGVVFYPGKGEGSRLVELLQTGEMPKGGGKLSGDEIALIVKWIDAGAPYDGDAAVAMGNTGSIGGGMDNMPTGNETVSFMKDIAPVLVANGCTTCHGGERGADNMEMDTWARMAKGGRAGDMLSAGNPSASLLIQMIKGIAKDNNGTRRRMPDRRPALKDDVIKKFETWIAEGAKFDGGDRNATFEFLLRQELARKSTHEELAKIREDLAKKNWNTGNPGVTPEIIEAESFRLVGDLTPVRMQEVAELAKTVQTNAAKALRVPPGKPMFKGKVTIFVFAKRFEYSEFGQMVEKREISSDSQGHFEYNVVDGYICLLNAKEGDPNVPLILAEGMIGSYIETLGDNLPRWFTIGSARAMAVRMEARAPLVKVWDETGPAAAGSVGNVGQFLTAKELDSKGSAVAYVIGKGMLGRGSTHHNLLEALRKGARFNQAMMAVYGANPQAMAAAWLKY
jgi:mono/diheme cytochrome c family protein